ncbi:MAG: hypothetical protein PVI11_08660 [Candidatus Aminicenantes bacterium]|jgi:hypothetical protein
MVEETPQNHLSYAIHEERKDPKAGFHRLDIILRETTEDQLYGVREIELRLLTPERKQDAIRGNKTTFTHQWKQDKTYKVVPGRIYLTYEGGKKLEFFTFGGNISIQGDEEKTHCTLESPAPIFQLNEVETLNTAFIEEVEILLAQEHAKWGDDDQVYWKHITQTPPLTLYASCLFTLQEKLEHNGYKRIRRVQELSGFIKREIENLEMENIPRLSSLSEKA